MADDEKTQNARDIVAAEWATVLAYGPERVDPIVPRTACGHPALRELFPMVGHGVLYLSRCTQYPWTHDVPTAFPQVAGGYRVRRESDRTLVGVAGTVEEAYELIAANLPEGCGPAVDGTPDDL
ncbi:DUF6193 family natural product biosynthesis protein [Streptomyces sp. NBC_01255]|uniref:DUF6193 family natural product biosynthesis protein n=1 Tax=Streptomyces sp. NBC_01255 TaxID=2903798 RepID=UPI002E3316C5|nr:DUF6193 family natural product biosynthesis protein [Streptomyces sp. NBC_01255]